MLNRLESLGTYDETLLIVTADHGSSFGEGLHRRAFRGDNYSDIALVPLLVKLPGQHEGVVSDRNVETVDIVPTIASVLSIEMPYQTHGRSLLDFDAPDRKRKTFVVRSATQVRVEQFADSVDRSYPSWERKLRTFGSKTEAGLYSPGLSRELIGEPVSLLQVTNPSPMRLEVRRMRDFAEVDLSAERLPLYISGELEGSPGRPQRFALALNGVIVATTESYSENGEWRVASALPEASFRDGVNDVALYLLDDSDGNTRLSFVKAR